MTDKNVPFKQETWDCDADGFLPDLCTDCGKPVRYGSRHGHCLDPKPTAALSSAAPSAAESVSREFTNELGNAIRITIEGPTSTSENVLTPMEFQELRAAINTALSPTSAAHVGDTRFEGWLSDHQISDVSGTKLPLYHKQDLREAYWAGYRERATLPAVQPEAETSAEKGLAIDDTTAVLASGASLETLPQVDRTALKAIVEAGYAYAAKQRVAKADAPVAEPVGHYAGRNLGGDDIVTLYQDLPKGQVLYTRPPAPEEGKDAAPVPLTVPTINKLTSAHEIHEYHPGAIVEFVRAVEAAHGIEGAGDE